MASWFHYDSDYTLVDSMHDSVRFAVDHNHIPYHSHLCAKSTFVDCRARIMHWHDFGDLEGPGWAANAVGGACEIYAYAMRFGDRVRARKALLVLEHVLDDGFVDYQTGFIVGYRDTRTDKSCLNFKHNDDWFCAGSMAKIGFQLLEFSDLLRDERRVADMRTVATKMAEWIHAIIKPLPNGWYPKRSTRAGKDFRTHSWGDEDPVFEKSGDGLFIVQLMVALTARGLADWTGEIRRAIKVFMDAGGIFGAINHDTRDEHENVAYAVAFRVLRAAANLLNDEKTRRFAYDRCLGGLDRFKLREDRNGVTCKGLLYMEDLWDTAYLWENAEAALAYVEAFEESGNTTFRDEAFTILHAISKHHHGPYGFLTEGVDWNNWVGRKHHFRRAKYGDIRYTEPLLNNLHHTEAALRLIRLCPELGSE